MKQKTPFRTILTLLFLLMLSYGNPLFAGTTPQDITADKQAIHDLITTMNQAVTERDLDGIVATFDKNALKVDLFPAHYPAKGDKAAVQKPTPIFPKTADLKERWQIVLGIMAGAGHYKRTATRMQIHVDGAMASAWVEIETETTAKDGSKKAGNRFIETVLLKKSDGQWRIVLTSNNRHDVASHYQVTPTQ